MKTHLRDSREFQKVYKTGRRYEGSFLTAFVKANDCGFHRLGITASKKALGNAVERNRAKRLLRETFRSSTIFLEGLQNKYDWVLNGRRALLSSSINGPQKELEKVIGAVAADERVSSLNKQELA